MGSKSYFYFAFILIVPIVMMLSTIFPLGVLWAGNETPGTMTISVEIPEKTSKGAGVLTSQGKISLSEVTENDILILLNSDADARLAVPQSVLINGGEKSAVFDLSIIDDSIPVACADPVTITAWADPWGSGSDTILIKDNLFVKHRVDGSFNGTSSVYAADVDGDGDQDILGAAVYANEISWFENPGSVCASWTRHTVDDNFGGAVAVHATDLDGDGDIDILGAATYDDEVAWWENQEGTGLSWIKHVVDKDFRGAKSVFSADVDGDGDKDILGAAFDGDDIVWWENPGNNGGTWTQNKVDGDFDGASSVYAADMDGDGDQDILGAGYSANGIAWWENQDGTGTLWVEHMVDDDYNYATSILAGDIDGDGDLDIIGASSGFSDKVTWWENQAGKDPEWIPHTVGGELNYATAVHAVDIDGDGDLDILEAAFSFNDIIWMENQDGSGTSWIKHLLEKNFTGADSIHAVDVDGDGAMDILGSATSDDDISWWENPKPTLTIQIPEIATEADGTLTGMGVISIDYVLPENLIIILLSNDTSEVRVPSTLEIPAGSTRVEFDLNIMNDGNLDALQIVTIAATSPGYVPGIKTIGVVDLDYPMYTVTINKAGNGTGTLSSNTRTVRYGENLTVTVSPSISSEFTGWSGDAGGDQDAVLTNIVSNKTITATFILKTYTIIVTSTTGGSTDKDGLTIVDYDESITITAIPEDDSYFKTWDNDATGSVHVLEFHRIIENKTVTAVFDYNPAAPVFDQVSPIQVTMDEDGNPVPFELNLSASDINSEPISWRIETPAGQGSATVEGTGTSKSVAYEPVENWHGVDQFVVEVSDNGGLTRTILVKVTVTNVNDAPVANGDTLDTDEETDLTQLAEKLLLNDTDVDNDLLMIESYTQPLHGIIIDQGSGMLTYKPDTDFNGVDQFRYTVIDVNGGVHSAETRINVRAVNDPPVNTAIPYIEGTAHAGQTLGANKGIWNDDKDLLPGQLSYTFLWQRADNASGSGLIDIQEDLSHEYQLTPEDSAKYIRVRITCTDDGQGEGNRSTIAISNYVYIGNFVPEIKQGESITVTMPEDGSPEHFALILDAIDKDSDDLTWSVKTQAEHGIATVSATGLSTSVAYSPVGNYNGPDTFKVQVWDGLTSGRDIISVLVTIEPVNDPPVSTPGASPEVTEDCGVKIVSGWAANIISGPADENFQELTFNISTTNALLFSSLPAIDPISGDLSFTPKDNAHGTAVVSFTLSDNGPGNLPHLNTSDQHTFTITVNASNDPPVISDVIPDQARDEDSAAWQVDLSGYGQDIEDDVDQLRWKVSQANTARLTAEISDQDNNILIITPRPNANGSGVITLTLMDSGGLDTQQNIFVTLNPVNDIPVNTAAPVLDGLAHAGKILTSGNGTWNDDTDLVPGNLSFTCRWQRADDTYGTNLMTIPSAVTHAYTLLQEDDGKYIRAQITCNDDGEGGTSQSQTAYSNFIKVTVTIQSISDVKGDLNGDFFLTFDDAMIVLKVLSIANTEAQRQQVTLPATTDVNGNKVVGLEELIFIMQALSAGETN